MCWWKLFELLLLLIGGMLVCLLIGEDFVFIKVCEGLNCILLFVDYIWVCNCCWCSMELCGNCVK